MTMRKPRIPPPRAAPPGAARQARVGSYMARGQPVAVRYVEPAPVLAGEEVHDSGAAAGALPTFTKPITGRAQVRVPNQTCRAATLKLRVALHA
jgi:hypothetical protein